MRWYPLVLIHLLCLTLLTACGAPMSDLGHSYGRSSKMRRVKPYPASNRGIQPHIVNNPLHRGPFWNSMLNEMNTNTAQSEVWDEMRQHFKLKHYENHPEVQAQINWYLNHPAYLQRVTQRSAQYIYYVMEEVKKRNLPAELALLPFIESAYNPFVSSNKGASGLWQLMPQTATGLGVKRNGWYDGRKDVAASTQAALDYLDYLNSFFSGDWFLAIAAYDYGEGNVSNAVNRNARQGMPTSFWDLKVPAETRSYVPRLLAFSALIENPDRYMIELPHVKNSPYFAQVEVGSHIKLTKAAQLCDISMNELRSLNPGFRPKTNPHSASSYQLLVPIHKVSLFQKRLAELPQFGEEFIIRTISRKKHSIKITEDDDEITTSNHAAPVREIQVHAKKKAVKIVHKHTGVVAKKATAGTARVSVASKTVSHSKNAPTAVAQHATRPAHKRKVIAIGSPGKNKKKHV